MAEVIEAVLRARFKHFLPSQIFFLGMAITQYNPVMMRPFLEYAKKEYDNATKTEAQKLNNKLSAEADKKCLTGKNKKEYIMATVHPFEKDRARKRDAVIKKRVEEL